METKTKMMCFTVVVEEGAKRRPLISNNLKRVQTTQTFLELLEELDGSLVPVDGELSVSLRRSSGSLEVFKAEAEALLSDVLDFKPFQVVEYRIVR